jgi:hypothetical protein
MDKLMDITGGLGIVLVNATLWQTIHRQMDEFPILFAADTREKIAECKLRNQSWKYAVKARNN